MTFEEANKIFESWRSYMEIIDKLSQIFNQIPNSFLPYHPEIIEEALNIVAKKFYDTGDKKMYDIIQGTMWGFLTMHISDEKAIESMHRSLELIINHSQLKKVTLEKLKERQDSWIRQK